MDVPVSADEGGVSATEPDRENQGDSHSAKDEHTAKDNATAADALVSNDPAEHDEAGSGSDARSDEIAPFQDDDKHGATSPHKRKSSDDAETQNLDDDQQTEALPSHEAETTDPGQKTDPSSLPRPIKRARSAYLIFAGDKRPDIHAANPGETMGEISKKIGQRWNSMSAQIRQEYHLKAAAERERVAKDLENWKAATGLDELPPIEPGTSPSSLHTTFFPVARIRKIIRLDPEVKGVSKEAAALVTKCAELAAVKLGTEAVTVARLQNRRKLIAADIAQVCSSREQFLFLQEDLKDLVREQSEAGTTAAAVKKTTAETDPATGLTPKPLTDYFEVASTSS